MRVIRSLRFRSALYSLDELCVGDERTVLARIVNVPPVKDRGLLRSCPRWTRPAQKCFLSESQDVFHGIGIPIQLASAFA